MNKTKLVILVVCIAIFSLGCTSYGGYSKNTREPLVKSKNLA